MVFPNLNISSFLSFLALAVFFSCSTQDPDPFVCEPCTPSESNVMVQNIYFLTYSVDSEWLISSTSNRYEYLAYSVCNPDILDDTLDGRIVSLSYLTEDPCLAKSDTVSIIIDNYEIVNYCIDPQIPTINPSSIYSAEWEIYEIVTDTVLYPPCELELNACKLVYDSSQYHLPVQPIGFSAHLGDNQYSLSGIHVTSNFQIQLTDGNYTTGSNRSASVRYFESQFISAITSPGLPSKLEYTLLDSTLVIQNQESNYQLTLISYDN